MCSRESASIYISKQLLDEGADLNIFDPEVETAQIVYELSNPQLNLSQATIANKVKMFSKDVLEACRDSHAIVVCTEWDQFRVCFFVSVCFSTKLNFTLYIFYLTKKDFDYEKIYEVMKKPAFLFDGRLILDHDKLKAIGFHVEAIGKKLA